MRELERLEEERLAGERRARERQRVAVERARDEERAAACEAEALRETERQKRAGEEATRDASRRAQVEAARVRTEATTRLEREEQEHRHALELARARGNARGGWGPLWGAGLTLGLCLLFDHFIQRPMRFDVLAQAERREHEAKAEARATRERLEELERENAVLRRNLEATRAPAPPAPGPTREARKGTTATTPKRPVLGATSKGPSLDESTCPKGDPLCP